MVTSQLVVWTVVELNVFVTVLCAAQICDGEIKDSFFNRCTNDTTIADSFYIHHILIYYTSRQVFESLEINLCFFVQAFPDNAARREVEALAAVCPNEGCTWTGTIKEFEVYFTPPKKNLLSILHLFKLLYNLSGISFADIIEIT